MIQQISVFLENKSGRLAELTRALGDANVNMRALMVADTAEFGVVRVICDAPRSALGVLEAAGFGASITDVIAVEVPNRPGGLADVLETLDSAGMNVEYAYCFVEPMGDAAVDIFRVDDPLAAEAALSGAGFVVVEPGALYSAD
jgi:hypothetical protein